MRNEIDHAEHSVLRELIIEHLFIGEALRRFWQRGITDVEILQSQIDSYGYDLVMSRGKIVRHIQLKTMKSGGSTDSVKISLRLMEKPSGCVVWMVVDPTLNVIAYWWFGGLPGQPLPNISGMKVAKHTKANVEGEKSERKAHREIKRSSFERLKTLDQLLEKLFGDLS